MAGATARKEKVIITPKSRLTLSQDISKSHSLKRESMSASKVVASGIVEMDAGATGGVSGKRRRKRRRRRRRNRKKKTNSQDVAIAGKGLDLAAKRGLLDPQDGCPYVKTGEDQSLQSDGGAGMAGAEGVGPGFTLATPARKVRKQVSGSIVCPNAVTNDRSKKKRKATEPAALPGTTASGPRKRPRINFKEIGNTETPSPRDIPFDYVIRRRRKRPLASGTEGKPHQEGGDRIQIQNQLIEECPKRMLEGESPTSGSPIEAVSYSTRYPGSPGLGPNEAQLPVVPRSGTLKSKSSVESQNIAQSPQDSPIKDHQRPGTAPEKAVGKVRGSRTNQVHGQRSQARKRSVSLPPARHARTSPYFADPSPRPRTKSSRTSPYFPPEVKIKAGSSVISWPGDDDPCYGLIQEELRSNPFQLLVACMFLNVTSNVKAVKKLREFLQRYPTPEILAQANVQDVTEMLKPLGLQNKRANTLIAFGKEWLRNPPTKYVGARKQGYPRRETLGALAFPGVSPIAKDERFEIAHLPGIGPYALDAWRIFCLDDLRGIEDGEEWTRVTPVDKELRGLLRWRWWTRKGVRWIEESDSEAFKKFWVMKCDGSVCSNMCKAGFPTQRCPRGKLDMADLESFRGHIPPDFVIGDGWKEAIGEQIDIPDPAAMADYIPFGHATTDIKGGGKPTDSGESAHPALATSAARRESAGTDSRGIVGENQALLSKQRKRRPRAEGNAQGNHHLRRGKDSNPTNGTPRSLAPSDTAETICYTLDPSDCTSQEASAVDEAHPSAPAPKPLKWVPLQSHLYEPPVSSRRKRKHTPKTQQGELTQEEASHKPKA